MAKQTIGIGSSANDGTGDTVRAAFDKCNDNFDEVYAGLLTDPSFAYIRTDGNDTTGVIGNPLKPYLTGQAAYDDGAKYFDIGAGCNAGNVILTANEELFLRGAGKNSLIYFFGNAYDTILWDVCGISCYMAISSYGVGGRSTLDSGDVTIHYGYVQLVETSGLVPHAGDYNGCDAGTITLFGPMAVAGSVSANGAAAGWNNDPMDAIGGNGGSSGTINIKFGVKFLDSATTLQAVGGALSAAPGGGGGSVGADGNIALRGCDTNTLTPDCGANTPTYCAAIVNGTFIAS